MSVLPLVRRVNVNADGPLLYESLQDIPYSFFLDTGMSKKSASDQVYSFIGALPFMVLEAKNGIIKINQEGNYYQYEACPWEELQRLLRQLAFPEVNTGFPFNGGAVGYFSYDLGRILEDLPARAGDDLATPDLVLGFYDALLVLDHKKDAVYIVSNGLPERGKRASTRARKRLEEMETLLTREKTGRAIASTGKKLHSHFTREEYIKAVQKVIDYIYAGDIFQANLSQRFTVDYRGDPWALYKRLREINPAPFAAYLNFGEFKVISASPERFLKVAGKKVQTRPIKGTRPRGKTPAEDNKLKEELLNSEKDAAELMMIVDLERNDLGKVCRVGTVNVPELVCLEEYATVYHLVSTIEGELSEGKDVTDLLKAAFPGGSITGAPKIRAMEIIEELEPVRRGIYTGSIGYIGFDGYADLNIVIRTIIAKGKRLYFQAGGGITAASNPSAEYDETLDKVKALLNALGLNYKSGGK